MKKVLKCVAVFACVLSAVSAILLGCLYLEDIVKFAKSLVGRFLKKDEE